MYMKRTLPNSLSLIRLPAHFVRRVFLRVDFDLAPGGVHQVHAQQVGHARDSRRLVYRKL